MKQLALAIAIASDAFKNKLDKGGQPYVLHLLRVWLGVKDESEDIQCAAWLHDLVEDFPDEWDIGKLLIVGFSVETAHMVNLLTHLKGIHYHSYINTLSLHRGATLIKMSDLRDNSDITRLKGLTNKDIDRLEKYVYSYNYLKKGLKLI
tara:strand:+ start:1448 stop:1894 length:447 start_codon:yes stop_codon:yes gene_type:complete